MYLSIKPFNKIFFKNCYYNSLFSILMYFDVGIDDVLSNNIPVYSIKSDFILNEYIEIQREDKLLFDLGMTIVEEYVEYESFYELIMNNIKSKSPLLIALYNEVGFEKFALIIGYKCDSSVFVIHQQHSDSLTYVEEMMTVKELTRRHLFGNKQKLVRVFLFNYSQDHARKDIRRCAISFIDNMTNNIEIILLGLKKLKDYSTCFSNILESTDIASYSCLVKNINTIINSCRVTRMVINGYRDCFELLKLKNNIESNWCYIRNKVMKSYFSKQKICESTSLNTVMRNIYVYEQKFISEIINM